MKTILLLLLPCGLLAQSGTYVRHTECSTDTIIIYQNGTFYKSKLYKSDYWHLGDKTGPGIANEWCGYRQGPSMKGKWKTNKDNSDTSWIGIDFYHSHSVQSGIWDYSLYLMSKSFYTSDGTLRKVPIPYISTEGGLGWYNQPNTTKYFKVN